MFARLFSRIFPTWQNALLAVLGAVLLILAFPNFDYWFLAWFALAPLMWAIEREKESGVKSFVVGWLFGTVFFFGTCWWLTFAPITYAGFPWWLAYFLLLCVCLVVGLFPAMFAGILSVLMRRFGSWAFLAAPFIWVFTEFLRYWITGNNWNAVGYSQAFSWMTDRFLFQAQIGGVYLVGFMTLAWNSFVATVISARTQMRSVNKNEDGPKVSTAHSFTLIVWGMFIQPLWSILILLVTWLLDYGEELEQFGITTKKLRIALFIPIVFIFLVWINTINSPFTVGNFIRGESYVVAVQPNVPMNGLDYKKYNDLRDKQTQGAERAFEENIVRYRDNDLGLFDDIDDEGDVEFRRFRYKEMPKLIVLPESPMNFAYNDDSEFQQFIGDFARRNNVSVLFNSAEPDVGTTKYFNSAVMVGPDGKEAAQYDKIYLLPFGEAVPSFLEGIVPGFVGNFSYGREYDILPVGDARAGVMICFESHFGALSRRYVQDGADVLIEMTNDGYLGPTPVLRQHLASAVFRAVETNRPVLRVTNVGITAYINERGQVLDEAPSYQEATRVWSVSKSDGSQTFYVKYGDWFAWLCTFATLGLLAAGLWVRRKPER